MSTKDFLEKDYYKALGVAKTAKPAEIKTAYRKLARKYHPDANKGDASAEERFKEISEAYSVLSDEKRRKEYDEARSLFGGGFRVPTGSRPGQTGGFGGFDLGDIFSGAGDAGGRLGDLFGGVFGGGGGRTTAQNRPRRGADVETETTLSFGDAIDGTTVALRLTGEGPCPTCHGTGAKAGTVPRMCPSCQGTGQSSRNLGSFGISEPCKECRGRGLVVDDPCPDMLGQRPGDELAHHPDAHPGRGRGRPADQDPGQGRSRRARRPDRRPVRPGAREAAPGVRAVGGQPDRDRAGDVRRADPRRGGQGALAPGRSGHRPDPAGHPERADVPGPGKGVRRKDGTTGGLLVTVEVMVPQNLNGKARSAIEDLREATAGQDPREELLERAKEA